MAEYGANEIKLGEPDYFVLANGNVENAKGGIAYQGSAQGAMEYAQSQCPAGGLVQLEAGKFPITKQTRAWHSTLGRGDKTVLYPSASLTQTMLALGQAAPSATNLVKDIVFGDMVLDGMSATYKPYVNKAKITDRKNFYGGLQLRHAKNCLVRGLTIKNIPASHGIQFQASNYNTVQGCTVENIGDPDIWGAYGNGICSGEMYAGYSCSRNLVLDSVVRDPSMVCVNWEPGDHNLVQGLKMYGNEKGYFTDMDNVKKYLRLFTIWQKGGFPASTGNIFKDCSYEGLGLAVSVNGAETDLDGLDITVLGPNGENYTAIYINGAKGADGLKVRNCKVRTMKGQCAIQASNIKNALIEDNELIGVGATVPAIKGTLSSSVIRNNKCTGYAAAPVAVTGIGNTIANNGPDVVLPDDDTSSPPASTATTAEPIISGSSAPKPSETTSAGETTANVDPVSSPVRGSIGVNDQCVVAWVLEGLCGQNRLVLGSGKVDPTTAVNASSVDELAKKMAAGCYELGLKEARLGAGDQWSSDIMYGAWKNNPTVFWSVLDRFAQWFKAYGLKLTITCLGFADGEYHQERCAIFDSTSPEFDDAMAYCGSVARHFGGHEGIKAVEIANEPEHDLYAFNHWMKKYPVYGPRLTAYSAWVKAAYDRTAEFAGEGHAVITMGHALIGAMFCVESYAWSEADGRYVALTWNYARNGKDYLKVPNDPLPRPSIHAYSFGAPVADFDRDWIQPFASYCKARGVIGFVGEHGDLRTRAAWYLKDIEDAIASAGLDSCAMRLYPRDGYPFAGDHVFPDSPASVNESSTEPPISDPSTSSPVQEQTPSEGTVTEPSEPQAVESSDPEPSETTSGPDTSANVEPSGSPESTEPEDIVTEPEPTIPVIEPETVTPEASTPETGTRRKGLFTLALDWLLNLFKRK